jgi:hypothetical protein
MRRSAVLVALFLSSGSFAPAAQRQPATPTIEVYKSPT